MYLRTLLILVVLGLLIIFALINWSAFTAQTSLSVVFTTVEAPLGLILLGIAGALTLLFLIYVVYLQSSALFESRRYARDLQAERDRAEQAEASRVNQLRAFLETEIEKLTKQNEDFRTAVLARLDEMDRDLRSTVEQSGNTLAAYIGEIDDRVERAIGGKV
jgi:uncharacterized integral membrane protein